MVKERPMLFTTDMVIATVKETKTNTRRLKGLEILNERPDAWRFAGVNAFGDFLFYDVHGSITGHDPQDCTRVVKCPYGKPKDLLWVRETWRYSDDLQAPYDYKAAFELEYTAEYLQRTIGSWKPSIHMPKDAARIWIQITDIRVERLQSITNKGAIAEGIQKVKGGYRDYTENITAPAPGAYWSFNSLWCKINGEASWDLNPWVWVITFKVLSTTGRPENISGSTNLISNPVKNESLKSSSSGANKKLGKRNPPAPRDDERKEVANG